MDSVVNYKVFGSRVSEKRQELNMTQEDLSRESGFSPVTISKIENGKVNIKLDALISIANALNTTVDELLAGNLLNNDYCYQSDIDVLLSDCSPIERHYLYETLRSVLLLLRSNDWKLQSSYPESAL